MELFIADLHLCPERPDITQAFRHFLHTTAQGAKSLTILGDLFETWIGDDDDTPLHLEICQDLKKYSSSGTALFAMHGNRDFLLGKGFEEATHATLLTDPTVINIAGIPTLISHGDSFCTRDQEYMQFRAEVRNPEWQNMILSKSLEERKLIAKNLRSQSHHMSSLKSEDIMDVTPSEIDKVMSEHNVTRMIHGHTHRPQTHHLKIHGKPAERIVLGDWDKQAWYLIAEHDSVSLRSFDLSTL